MPGAFTISLREQFESGAHVRRGGMPHFWDYFFPKPSPTHRNLQEGLFQIASQTCSLLVQVNNTNNITFGDNASNISCTNVHNNISGVPLNVSNYPPAPKAGPNGVHQDQEQLLVLIPPTGKSRYKPTGTLKKPRLSTVLEGPVLSNDEESELWNHGYVLPADHDSSPSRRWGNKRIWCRPSCIPISIILIMIFLVVLLPLLDHTTEKALKTLNALTVDQCQNTCSISLVESIPEGVTYPGGSITNPTTYETWMDLIEKAQTSIEIASFYWTMRAEDIYPDPSSKQGEEVFEALMKAGLERKITVKIAQNAPSAKQPNLDTELLVKRKAAEVKNLNFAQLMGSGVLHTKLWIIDRRDFYLGSANMDWRALTQVKEMGVVARNCTCLTEDISKIFDVYWVLGSTNSVPSTWPLDFETEANIDTPMNVSFDGEIFNTYISSSPPPFSPKGRSDDIDAIINSIRHAEKFIYISVMDYFPLMIYSPKVKYWPIIDDALRSAAIEHKVEVRMLISWWNHSRSSEDYFLKSLGEITDSYPKVSIAIRRFVVPSNEEQKKIPFARVNHNKYMVTDNTAYIGTSNWSGDYFTNTAGIGFVLHDPVYNRNQSQSTLRSQLQAVFERDWNSNYSHPMGFQN